MKFLEYLASRFSAEKKNTEMYRLLSAYGSYTEATLAQEARALIDRNTDPTKMLESDIRKFLSFFFIPVRNYVPASGKVSVKIDEASDAVVFQGGDLEVIADNGTTYQVISSAIAYQGETVELQIRQTRSANFSGVYDEFIVIDSPSIALDSLALIVDGKSIPQVYTPRDGFMAFMFNGKTYIKVFPGPNVPRIRDKPYSLGYLVSDGARGNVDANSFASFSRSIADASLNPVKLTLTNAKIENGASSPSLGELRDLLRYWLFTRNSLVKTSDYRRWFMIQPEVGDCLVWGDTEEFRRTGALNITGKLKVCLLSAAGEVLAPETKLLLNDRVQAYKDVAYLEYVDPTFVKHFIEVRFVGSLDDARFTSDALYEIQARYDLNTLRENNMSLFDALDVGSLSTTLGRHVSAPNGLEVIPYYYIETDISEGASSFATTLPNKDNVKAGFCKYVYEDVDAEGNITDTETFTELMTSLTQATIIRANGSSVGTHNYTTNTISITPPAGTFGSGRMKVFAEAKNRSQLDTGAFAKARKLGGISFVKVAGL